MHTCDHRIRTSSVLLEIGQVKHHFVLTYIMIATAGGVFLMQVTQFKWYVSPSSYFTCRHGPLITMWTMRYEAKHRYFKRWASIMGNFKNISKTLAVHHQKHLCYQMTTNTYLTESISTGPGEHR